MEREKKYTEDHIDEWYEQKLAYIDDTIKDTKIRKYASFGAGAILLCPTILSAIEIMNSRGNNELGFILVGGSICTGIATYNVHRCNKTIEQLNNEYSDIVAEKGFQKFK